MKKKINILLLDDSKTITTALKIMLVIFKRQCIIQTANTLKKADKIIEKKFFDIIILDIQVNNNSGIDFLKKIKKIHPETTLIILTNYYDSSFLKIAEKSGAAYFFDKSMEFEKILDVVREKLLKKNNSGLLFNE